MAISTFTNWDVRPGSGSDTLNSGGFIPGSSGTDWSQQNSAQYSLTSLTSSGVSAIILTSSASSDMVGNLIQITSGTNFTVGFYQILSIVAGVSITVDRNATTGVGASGVGAIGGSLATIAVAYGSAVGGNHFYLKGTLNVTTPLTMTLFPASGVSATTFEGYTTTHGDGGRATWTTSTNSTRLIQTGGISSYAFRNINFSTTATTVADGVHAESSGSRDWFFYNCSFSGFINGINGNEVIDWQISVLGVYNCEIKNCTAEGIFNTGTTFISDCYFHANTGPGFRFNPGGDFGNSFINRSVFYGNGTNGLWLEADENAASGTSAFVTNCVFSDNTGSGYKIGLGTFVLSYGSVIVDCIFYNNTAYGINYVGAGHTAINQVSNCAFGSNSTAPINNFSGDINTVTLTADPFVGRTTGNFALNSTAGGGALLRGTGFPGVGLFGTGFIDIGPLQSSGGGASGALFVAVADVLFLDDNVGN